MFLCHLVEHCGRSSNTLVVHMLVKAMFCMPNKSILSLICDPSTFDVINKRIVFHNACTPKSKLDKPTGNDEKVLIYKFT